MLLIPLMVFGGVQFSRIGDLYDGTNWESPSYLSSDRKTITSVSGAANTLTSRIQTQKYGRGSLWIKAKATNVDGTINTTLTIHINRGDVWESQTLGTISSSPDSIEVILSDSTYWQDKMTHEYYYKWTETGNQSNGYELYEWKTVERN